MENIKPETLKKKLERPSTMAKKFALMPKGWEPPPIPYYPEAEGLGLPGYFRKQYIFFYGTLTDKAMLAKVLGLSPDDERLKLRPARLEGYHTKLWGPYPALLNGPLQDSHVDGLAYEAQSQDEVDRLSAYETDKYALNACIIQFLDIEDKENQKVIGETFIWNGNPEELTERNMG
ncbi:hypothetical protein FQN49_002517 [Arthroderma sp. PD_2]|nr:hypothetical protein FQN49_002517 [Arthroderma sp. PD_2]